MRESENVIGRIKNEQKGTVLERGRSVRKAVDGPQCSHVSQTRPPPPDPTKTLVPPLVVMPFCYSISSYCAWDLASMDSFRGGPWSWALPEAAPSTHHSSSLTSYFT